MSLSDMIEWACVLIALWYVPRYLLKVYAPGVLPWLRSWWQYAVDAQRQRANSVNNFQDAAGTAPHIMSRQTPQTVTDGTQTQTDERVSEADRWIERLRVDRTKLTLIELTAYTGWSVDEIRKVIKGDNNVLGSEIEGARKRQGIEPEPSYITPIVGRATNARFETDPDYPYQAPAH